MIEVLFIISFDCVSSKYSACVFDIEAEIHKKSTLDEISHNEMLLELYKSGAFKEENRREAICLIESMSFENKDSIIERIKEN